MTKKVILTVVLATALVLAFGLAMWKILKTPQRQGDENFSVQEKPATTNDTLSSQSEENLPGNESQVKNEIDTSDWKTYRNEEYGFEFKYPNYLYLKDFTKKFLRVTLGLFLENKQEGYEYFGDIEISVFQKPIEETLIDYYSRIYGMKKPNISENIKFEKSDNGYEMLTEYNIPANVDHDRVMINCENKIIRISTPFGEEKEILNNLSSTILCL